MKRKSRVQQHLTNQQALNDSKKQYLLNISLPNTLSVQKVLLKKTQSINENNIMEQQQQQNMNIRKKQNVKKLKLKEAVQTIQKNKDEQQIKEQLYQLLLWYSFFSKIYRKNKLVYQELIDRVEIEKYPKGKILIMLGQKAEKSYLILKGSLGVYIKANFSMEKIKSYRENFGEELQSDFVSKNPLMKRRSLLIQQENANLGPLLRKEREYSKIFENQDQFFQWFPDLTKVATLKEEESIDQGALKKNLQRLTTLITEDEVILVSISKINYLEAISKHENMNIILEERLEKLRKFKIFSNWQQRLNNIVHYFERKTFIRGQIIFKQGADSDKFYLVTEGQVETSVFIKKSSQEQQNKSQEYHRVSIALYGKETYFGEQEIFKRSKRNVTAESIAAYTEVLCLTKKNFFIVGYGTDFFYNLRNNLEIKIQNRQEIIKNNLKIQKDFTREKTPQKVQYDYNFLLTKKQKNTKISKINNHRPSIQITENKVICLHGNKICQLPKEDKIDTEISSFSMLKSNQDMYQATLKKFRRYHKKQLPKPKIQVNWDMKRVWKVLNLDDLLTEQNPMKKDPEAIKYFYKHNRLLNQINESRALRPKTSSSSYKQKVKYVNYLHEFNQIAKSRKFSMI